MGEPAQHILMNISGVTSEGFFRCRRISGVTSQGFFRCRRIWHSTTRKTRDDRRYR